MLDRLSHIKAWALALGKWRQRWFLSFLGLLSAAALPPIHLAFLLLPGLTFLVWRLGDCETRKEAFFVGWWFGFGFFAGGLYWISHSFFVDAATHGWMAPFAITGLAAGLAIFIGLTTLSCWLLEPRGIAGVLNLAVCWTLFEWVRGWIFTGFPWNLLGSVWVFSDEMIQVTALIGTFGLSLVTVWAAASPALLASRYKVIATLPFLLLAVFWIGGTLRLSGVDTQYVKDVKLRIVQPNIPQHEKWKAELRQTHFLKMLYMSADPRGDQNNPPTHYIWPETAVPFFLTNDPQRLKQAGSILTPEGIILTGVPSATARGETPFRVFNSVIAINSQGRLEARYDKHHLVPFGEYVPYRDLLTWENLNLGGTDFTPGAGPKILNLPGLPPTSPLICYEVIFPGALYPEGNRPGLLLNLTNDAWFGRSSGPYQHLAAAKLRAVEEGIPLVRAANTGISAVFDSYGRRLSHLPLGKQAVLDSYLPKPLETAPLYGRYHNGILAFLVVLTLSAGVFAQRQTRQV